MIDHEMKVSQETPSPSTENISIPARQPNLIYCIPYTTSLTSLRIQRIHHLLVQYHCIWFVLICIDHSNEFYTVYKTILNTLQHELTTQQYNRLVPITFTIYTASHPLHHTQLHEQLFTGIQNRIYYIDSSCPVELISLLLRYNEPMMVEPELNESIPFDSFSDSNTAAATAHSNTVIPSRYDIFSNIHSFGHNVSQLPSLVVNTTINSMYNTVNTLASVTQPITSAPSKLYNYASNTVKNRINSSNNERGTPESQYVICGGSQTQLHHSAIDANNNDDHNINFLSNIRSYVTSPLIRSAPSSNSVVLDIPLPPISIRHDHSSGHQTQHTDDEND